MRARGAGGVRARGGGDAAGDDARCEVFSHPVYGLAMRARVAVPAHTMLLEEPPLLYGTPPARLEAVCDQAVEALGCQRTVPERMLAFAAAPEDVRRRVLALYCGGGPDAWPQARADSDIFNDQIVYSSDNTLAVAPAVAAWLAERVPEAAAAGGADSLARAVAVFCFNAFGVERDGTEIPVLYERNAKVAHACNWAANSTFFRPERRSERGCMLTLAPITPGAPLLYDYTGGGTTMHTTAVRRHLLRRGKMFDCFCDACAAPDALAALPCPACVPRDPATGLVPLSRLEGELRELFSHPVVVPDGVRPGASAPPAWRCDTCGGVFSPERMAALQIAAGLSRPSPRTSTLQPAAEPASLLDVARWADAAVSQMLLEMPHSPLSATPESEADFLSSYMPSGAHRRHRARLRAAPALRAPARAAQGHHRRAGQRACHRRQRMQAPDAPRGAAGCAAAVAGAARRCRRPRAKPAAARAGHRPHGGRG